MTVIFTNLNLKDLYNKTNKFIKNNRILKYVSCLGLAAMAVIITFWASGITFGYTVSYSDRVIAVVSCEADYNKADAIVSKQLDEKTARESAINPKFGITLTVTDRLNDTEEIVNAIIDNNDDLVEATALKVNGEVVVCVENGGLETYVNNQLQKYYIEGAENSATFVDDVKVEKGYFLKADIVPVEEAISYVDGLAVETVSKVTKAIEIPYETKNVKTDKKPIGYSAVTTKGENGISEKVVEIVKYNEEEYLTVELSETVVKEQVAEIVTVGTGINYTSPTHRMNAASAGFICPVSRSKFVVSAYFGDGRGHKGIDLAADKGTPIFAAAAGKVIYSGFDSDFGYNVVIQHSNGMKTRYAHANALCVTTGSTVAQGDMIATVGNTGWSTGNHLHFEVIVNGNRVNPGPYIGLN